MLQDKCPTCGMGIDEHGPSRCLEAWIAEKVEGWRWFDCAGIAVLVPPMMAEEWAKHPVLYKPLDDPGKREREHIDGVRFYDSARGGNQMPEFPHSSTDIATAFEMEAEIERQGLAKRYAYELMQVLSFFESGKDIRDDFFALVHASPLDRCKAALRAAAARGERTGRSE
jgi:hypothetical protein